MNVLKEAIFAVGRAFPRLSSDRGVILMYHSVAETGRFFTVTPARFERQMRYLSENKIPVIALKEMVRRLHAHESMGGAVAITFDDGYQDNLTNAFPVLKKYGLPATVYVITDLIGKTDSSGLAHLSEDELRTLELSGIDIEPHTRSHARLSKTDAHTGRDEIAGSKNVIEQLLKKHCVSFAYPWGAIGDETPRIVKECGFEAAVTVQEGTVGPDADPFRLPRVAVDSETSFSQFCGKLTRVVDGYEWLKSLFGYGT